MKKLIALGLISVGIFTNIYAYTTTDVQNANYLADRSVIPDWESSPETYKLDSYMTRVEVMDMVLRMRGVTQNNSCRWDFGDIHESDPYYIWVCRIVETAADNNFINAQREKSASMRVVRPYDRVTRSEALAIFLHAFPQAQSDDDYSYFWNENFPNVGDKTGYRTAYYFGEQWQTVVFYAYIRKVLRDDAKLHEDPRVSYLARKSEVFGFAKNILNNR